MASFTSSPPQGSRSRVVTTLKRVCMLAICAAGLSVRDCMKGTSGVTWHRMVNRTVPMMLKDRCTTVVRLALRLVPMAASTAVMQVPMFWPKRT